MYSYIKGTLEERDELTITVENGGIGYLINMPFALSSELGHLGSEVKVYVYQSVKEDDISLFGFNTRDSKDMFMRLISVSGVGPKVAHSICSQLSPEKFAMAVISGNVASLTQVKGLGKKGAERIIVDLKDKMKEDSIANRGKSVAVVEDTESGIDRTVISGADTSVIKDAEDALVMLGYKPDLAVVAVAQSYEEGISLENLIKKALKAASGGKFA
ncbi:MAG: Holliday junction branch migration protein RuvA [Clostridiales bacterium]|nr:Holliday junction branch migration protein RuvA [Clostridiales bacterium]